MNLLKKIAHIIIVILLTLITQVGGLLWILVFGLFHFRKQKASKLIRYSTFFFIYLIISIFLVPPLAKLNNRIPLPISKSGNLIPHNYMTPLLNRHYVKATLKMDLIDISNVINAENNRIKISYLDANFPFIDGFPLLPHISHSDGKKIDIAFYYTRNKIAGNLKPSNSGYGKFVQPKPKETNYTEICKSKGYWQYDYTKFATLGSRNDLEFDLKNTRRLIHMIVEKSSTQKLLIEPHLKNRMNLTNNKIRFHGCHAVRHDDHIHYQIN